MANIIMRTHKDGSRAYTIRVYRGVDPITGKQLSPYVMTWIALSTWSEAKSNKEAEKQANLFEDRCKNGQVTDGKTCFYDYAIYAINLKESNGAKHKTIRNYKASLQIVTPYIGHIKLSDLRPKHLNDMYIELLKRPSKRNPEKTLSAKTILEHHRFISSILSLAVKEGAANINVAERATPPIYKRKTPNYYQLSIVDKIIESLEDEPLKWKVYVYLLLSTGARRGEICGLEWSRIKFEEHIINLNSTLLYASDVGVYKETIKEDNPHWVKVPIEMIEMLKEYKKWWLQQRLLNGDRWKGTDYIFIRDDGSPMHPDSVNNWLCKFEKRHDLPHLNPHAFRHTHVSILLFKGADKVDVSNRVGHKQLSTTENFYAQLIQEAEEASSECIADVLFNNCSTRNGKQMKNEAK